jgi:hypothetical protein
MEKPSCINQLKRLAGNLTSMDESLYSCITKVKEIAYDDDLTPSEKITKIKELCKEHGK